MPEHLHGAFGPEVDYIAYRPRQRFMPWRLDRCVLWHNTFQHNVTRPPAGVRHRMLTVHDLNYRYRTGPGSWRDALLTRIAIARSNCLVSISDYVGDDVRRHITARGRRVTIHNGATDLSEAPQRAVDGLAGRRFFFHVSRMAPSKNVEAIVGLARAWPERTFVLAGPAWGHSKQLHDELGDSLPNVRVLLGIDDARRPGCSGTARRSCFRRSPKASDCRRWRRCTSARRCSCPGSPACRRSAVRRPRISTTFRRSRCARPSRRAAATAGSARRHPPPRAAVRLERLRLEVRAAVRRADLGAPAARARCAEGEQVDGARSGEDLAFRTVAGRPLLQLPGVPDPDARGVLPTRSSSRSPSARRHPSCSLDSSRRWPCWPMSASTPRAIPGWTRPGVSPPARHERARGDRPPSTRFRLPSVRRRTAVGIALARAVGPPPRPARRGDRGRHPLPFLYRERRMSASVWSAPRSADCCAPVSSASSIS